jgi:hypothetical protein
MALWPMIFQAEIKIFKKPDYGLRSEVLGCHNFLEISSKSVAAKEPSGMQTRLVEVLSS